MCPPVVLCNWIYFIPSLFVCTIMHDCCLSAYSFVCFYGYLALCVLSFQHIRYLSVYHSILFLCVETSGAEAARFSENLSKISAVCKLQPLNQCPTVLFFFLFISEPNHTEARDFFLPVNSRLELLLSLPSAP